MCSDGRQRNAFRDYISREEVDDPESTAIIFCLVESIDAPLSVEPWAAPAGADTDTSPNGN